MRIRADPAAQDVVHREPVHLVPRALRIARPAALARGEVERAVIRQVQVRASAQSLEQKLIEQPRAHQPRIESRKAAEVIVIEIERNQLYRLEANRQETARYSC